MEIHRKMFLWSLGGTNSPRGVSQVNWDHFGDCGDLKKYIQQLKFWQESLSGDQQIWKKR